MKVINLGGPVPSLKSLLGQARKNNLLIRTEDGTEFLLAEVDDFDREIALVRQNAKLMALLDRRSQAKKTITLAEAKKRLGMP